MPKVFIVLATWQGEAYLSALIESVRRQTCGDWTLIARDDGSSDATPEILRQAAVQDHRVSMLDADGRRLGAAGNFGVLMQAALDRGADYLLLADQDDVWHPDKVERQLRCLREAETMEGGGRPHLVCCDLAVVDAALRPIHPSFLNYCRLRWDAARPLPTLLGRSFVLGCASAINRPLLELALPLPENVASHDWWVALCAASAGKISCLAEPLLDYRRHQHNASATPFWTVWNPMQAEWRQRWKVGTDSFRRSVGQARSLRQRLQRPGTPATAESRQILERFCGVFERPSPRWRQVLELCRLGVPAINLSRRLLYYLCVLTV